ncbi:hypothetical protein SFUMM280S_01963 [Streptomyces fumanus]
MARDAGAITEVAFRPALSAPIGMDVVDFAELRARGRRRGIDLSSPQRPAFHHLIHVHPGSPPLDHTVDFTRHVVPPGGPVGAPGAGPPVRGGTRGALGGGGRAHRDLAARFRPRRPARRDGARGPGRRPGPPGGPGPRTPRRRVRGRGRDAAGGAQQGAAGAAVGAAAAPDPRRAPGGGGGDRAERALRALPGRGGAGLHPHPPRRRLRRGPRLQHPYPHPRHPRRHRVHRQGVPGRADRAGGQAAAGPHRPGGRRRGPAPGVRRSGRLRQVFRRHDGRTPLRFRAEARGTA